MPREDGWRSCHTSFGHIGLHLKDPLGKPPFSMTYGAETIIPLETGFSTLRTSSFAPRSNNDLLEKSFDLVEEQSGKNHANFLNRIQQVLEQKYLDVYPLITVPTEYTRNRMR